MNYSETLSYLYASTPVFQHVGGEAYKEGLSNSLALDNHLHHPHTHYLTIHVGGTNGKGSTSHLLAAILQESGYKVGLYTSPHLVDFRERIRVNGEMIAEEYVVNFVADHKAFFEPLSPSFFELTMMMAFDYFAFSKVDIAIIEVGLGGRLDSTNIISPIVSVITNISFDHTQFLGNTLEKIALEKAGIIKPNTPVVIGEAQGSVREVFEKKAKERQAPLFFAEDEENVLDAHRTNSGQWLFQTKEYPRLTGELGGLAQQKNANTVLSALKQLKQFVNIPKEAVYKGFEKVVEITGLQGRWQVFAPSPKLILDTGHNEAGIEQIAAQLKNEPYNRLHFIFGVVKDKDITSILNLLPKEAIYYFTKAQIPRSLPENELQRKALSFQLNGAVYSSLPEAITKAKETAQKDDLIFIGGSNFVVGEALEFLLSEEKSLAYRD